MTFGGPERTLGRPFLERVRRKSRGRALPVPWPQRRSIDFASLGGDAGYIGAAGVARLEYRKLAAPRVRTGRDLLMRWRAGRCRRDWLGFCTRKAHQRGHICWPSATPCLDGLWCFWRRSRSTNSPVMRYSPLPYPAFAPVRSRFAAGAGCPRDPLALGPGVFWLLLGCRMLEGRRVRTGDHRHADGDRRPSRANAASGRGYCGTDCPVRRALPEHHDRDRCGSCVTS